MRGSVLGSGLVHAALLVVLLVVRTAAPVIVPGPDVVNVALVDAPNMTTVAQLPPPPPKPEEAPEIAPVEDEGVKLEKEKKKKKEPEKKEPERREPDPPQAQQAALPYASVGSAGLRGQIALDAGDFEFTYYLLLVRNKVTQNWTPPAGGAGGTVRAVVYFKISRGGGISAITLETSSGAEYFDRSTIRAVTISNPLPPLPLGYSGSQLGVHFGFEFSPP